MQCVMANQALMAIGSEDVLGADHALVVGKEFPDVESCRRTLKDLALALHFDLRIVKSDRSRFIAKCSMEGCPWRIHVPKCPGVPTFSVRTLNGEHTCEGVHDLHHQQALVGWVARSLEARIRDNPQYKPKEILQDIRDEHGVSVSYMQAWRGKERSMAALHGTYEEGYRLLPAYCEQIKLVNPGSFASVSSSGPENCFQRLFIAYQACIAGFTSGCRPLLELDRAHLKGKYLGTILCAAAVDADDGLFPLAVAVVDIESDENWMWFLSELRKLLGMNPESMPRDTTLSERHSRMVAAVSDLGNLIRLYSEWHSHLLPYYSFDQFVHKVQQVATTKSVKNCINELRERVASGVDPNKLYEKQEENTVPREDHDNLDMDQPSHDNLPTVVIVTTAKYIKVVYLVQRSISLNCE